VTRAEFIARVAQAFTEEEWKSMVPGIRNMADAYIKMADAIERKDFEALAYSFQMFTTTETGISLLQLDKIANALGVNPSQIAAVMSNTKPKTGRLN